MIEKSIEVKERKVAILCSQKRYKEAEKVFMDMVNRKEAQGKEDASWRDYGSKSI